MRLAFLCVFLYYYYYSDSFLYIRSYLLFLRIHFFMSVAVGILTTFSITLLS